MTTTANTAKTAREFEFNGSTYVRKESGYCFRDGKRVSAAVVEAAEAEFDAREQAKAREIEGVRKDLNPTFEVDGDEFVCDWYNKKYYKNGSEISKAEYEAARDGGEAPKAKARKRRPKDVAGEFETTEGVVTLTAKQLDFFREVAKLNEDDLLGSFVTGCWCDILTDAIGGQFAGKPMTVGAMVSTVCEKGLGVRSKEKRSSGTRERTVTTFSLTQKGREVWEQVTAC